MSQRRIFGRQFLRHLLAHAHQPLAEGHDEAFDVGAGDVFQVATGPHARLERRVDHAAVRVHALLQALELQLLEDVVVGAAGEDAGFLQAGLFDQAEVALVGADPAGALGIAMAQLAAAVQGVAVVAGVEEELRLADDAVRPAQLGQQIVDADHLVGRVGRPGLLTVAEGRIGNENIAALHLGRVKLHRAAIDVFDHRSVELDQRRQTVGKRLFQQVRFGPIDQGVGFAMRHDKASLN